MAIPEYDISGRKIVLVGASRGIGRGVADVLAEAGAQVAIASVNIASAEKAAAAIRAAGGRASAHAADATRTADMERLAGEVAKSLGAIDVLVNCVGDSLGKPVVARPGRNEEGMSEADWHRIMDINLTQAYAGCKAFGPRFLDQGRGAVINISGIAAFRPQPARSAYAAAKAAVVAFTEATALEWAPHGVRVNAIAPGSFPDPSQLGPEAMQERHARAMKNVPLGRIGQLREVGLLALYLASDASAYVTGQTFCIDGGASIG
jgi:NAD(P)-dependent dehydrogenase (short-subunit alcohol dehydrogenase family)